LQDGLAFHTLQPSADGATVYVFGSYSDAATVEAIGKSVEQNDTQARFTAGSGSFIGTQLGDADTDDKGQRDDARKVYEAEIQQADAAGKLPGRDIGKLWQQVRDSWAASSSQVKLFRGGGAWDEGEHPRDEQGRFTDSGGSGESSDSGGDGSASDTSGRTATELFQSGDRTTDIEKAIDSVQGAREMIAKAAEKLAGATRTDALVSQGGHRHPDGRYTAEREALHMKILAELFTPEAIKAATPKAGEKPVMTVLGGRGGSGKTWFTSSGLADRNKAIYVNSDDFKSALPEYAGWNAALVHEESTHILAIAEAYAREIGVNVIEDATLKNAGSTQQRVEEYKKSGYEIHGYYMYVSPQMSMERALGRFVHGTEKAKGDGMGRFVAPEYLAGALTNEMSFDNVKGEMSKWGIYDNMGGKPKLYAESK
jgi:predicted ABC-type ATPase